jgi:hypothetical protein
MPETLRARLKNPCKITRFGRGSFTAFSKITLLLFLTVPMLTIASFTPGYWYVKAVNDLRNMVMFNLQNLMPVIYSILIQLVFTAALIIIALFVTKQRRMSKA